MPSVAPLQPQALTDTWSIPLSPGLAPAAWAPPPWPHAPQAPALVPHFVPQYHTHASPADGVAVLVVGQVVHQSPLHLAPAPQPAFAMQVAPAALAMPEIAPVSPYPPMTPGASQTTAVQVVQGASPQAAPVPQQVPWQPPQPQPTTQQAAPGSLAADAEELHETLRRQEADEMKDPELLAHIGHLLFMKRKVLINGVMKPYVASSQETRDCILALLARRRDFMQANDMREDRSTKYVFRDAERAAVMKAWKEEYHAEPEQLERQRLDSWKPQSGPEAHAAASSASQPACTGGKGAKGKDGNGKKGQSHRDGKGKDSQGTPDGDSFGPNMTAVRKGKHSRFARHLQRVAGSKQMAEVIIFTGKVDTFMLTELLRGGSQPVENLAARPENLKLKREADTAKWRLRHATLLQKRLERGALHLDALSTTNRDLLEKLQNGILQQQANAAIRAFGHGDLRDETGRRLSLGGSTGGLTRCLLDGWAPKGEEDIASFFPPRTG